MIVSSHETYSNTIVTVKENIHLWVETFGHQKNPAVLLNMGAGGQCKLWPDEFCAAIAANHFFVIRYDYRDTGKSSAINFQKDPYSTMDLTKDAVTILEHFNIQSAHIMGFSMGGQIAQFFAAYFPQYVKSITLIGTSTSFREGFDAFLGRSSSEGLSPPKPHYIKWASRNIDVEKMSYEEKIENFIASWKILNGDNAPFDTEFFKQIAIKCITRSNLFNPYLNHASAMQACFEEHRKAPALIKAKTLIIHGGEDPVFGIDHAYSLQNTIINSKLIILETMGHNLNMFFLNDVLENILNHLNH